MKKTDKLLLSSAFFLFTAWLALIVVKWNDFQTLRRSDPMWLLETLSPELFVIIIGLVLIISCSLWLRVDRVWFHAILIAVFGSVLLCTPYFVGSVARFPDTFGVVNSVQNLSDILGGSSTEYAADYPIAYLLFHSVSGITQQNLFDFSQWVFSPTILISFLLIWYLFIRRISTPSTALLATVIAIPVLIVEVSITPNSLGMVLAVSALFFLAVGNKLGKVLMLFLSIVLVLVHPMNIIMLLVFLISFALVNILTRKEPWPKVRVPLIILPLIVIGWLVWSAFSTLRGMNIVRTVMKLFGSRPSSNGGVGDMVNTGLSNYPWVQEMLVRSYMIFAGLGIVIFAYIVIHTVLVMLKRRQKSETGLFGANNVIPYMLISSIILFSMAFTSLYLVAGGEQIVSRSMNYAMLALSVCIAIFILAICRTLKTLRRGVLSKALICTCIFMFVFVSVAYPMFGYSKESYISFTESYISGDEFEHSYLSDVKGVKSFSVNSKGAAMMKSTYHQITYERDREKITYSGDFSSIYTNGNIELYLKSLRA